MYGNASIAEILQSHDTNPVEDNSLQDFIGSPSRKEAYDVQGFLEAEQRAISAQLSIDGVNPFSSNKVVYSMWRIMLTVFNLPKPVGNLFSNMLLVGIIPGNGDHEAKSADPYLEVVVDELLALSGATFYDAYRKAPFNFKVRILSYVLDYPGLNKVFNCTGTNTLKIKFSNIGSIQVGDCNVSTATSARNLGSWFDSKLSMSTHITKLSSSSFYYLYNIRRIRKYLSRRCTETLVHAFITTRIDYCNSLLYGLPDYRINKLQRIQNAAARLICPKTLEHSF